jgi:hypothetical protein
MKKLFVLILGALGLAATQAQAQDLTAMANDASAAAAYYDATGVVTTGINEISLIGQGQQQAADAAVIEEAATQAWEEVEPLVHVVLENLGEILDAIEQIAQEVEPFLVDLPDQPDPNIAAEC